MTATDYLPVARRLADTRAEQAADAAIHFVGVTGALMAAPVLVTLAATLRGDPPLVAAIVVYGVSLIAMMTFSASYHLANMRLGGGRVLDWLRRCDHAAIYIKIAGTYTPFAVIAGGSAGEWLLIGVWSGAALGSACKLIAPWGWERWSIPLYMLLGWAFVFAAGPISASLTDTTLVLIAIGGSLYTVGVLFHLWESLPFQNAIWHSFVLVASFVFYAAMVVEVSAGG